MRVSSIFLITTAIYGAHSAVVWPAVPTCSASESTVLTVTADQVAASSQVELGNPSTTAGSPPGPLDIPATTLAGDAIPVGTPLSLHILVQLDQTMPGDNDCSRIRFRLSECQAPTGTSAECFEGMHVSAKLPTDSFTPEFLSRISDIYYS
jgi:hypothetical protein